MRVCIREPFAAGEGELKMCRLLAVRSPNPIDVTPYLRSFASVARDSREYQGHGWGCALWTDGGFEIEKSIRPIWEDELPSLPKTRLFLAHARSAFRDEGIRIENNMPFSDGKTVFIFNGELRGVRVREQGRIGAEKVFHFVKRFEKDGWPSALVKGAAILAKRSAYVRAMNMIVSNGKTLVAHCRFAEDPDYFTLHRHGGEDGTSGPLLICSAPLRDGEGGDGWQPLANGETWQAR